MTSYQEARRLYIACMGEGLGTTYHLLWNQCALLHQRWDEYVALFGKDQEQFEIMNTTAPGFFKSVQDTLWESVLLQLCHFTDPDIVAYRRTLSFASLAKYPESKQIPDFTSRVQSAKQKTKFAQDWRNRRIAHTDLEHAFDHNVRPLAPATRVSVREALDAIADVLSAVEKHFTGYDLRFGDVSPVGSGQAVLRDLKLARELRRRRMVRLKAATPTDEDCEWTLWNG